VPDSSVTAPAPVPPEERYCTDIPSTLIAASVGLCSSMKSWVRVAPELPPPP
jgi:hypothetical protein